MENKEEILQNLSVEMRKGTIVLSVLAKLNQAQYGYELSKNLEDVGLSVEKNTLYPLLRRLETQGLLESDWDTGDNKPKKYYRRTSLGNEVLRELEAMWLQMRDRLQALLEEE